MRVSVFGLGYVGCVSAACLAASGNDVWGVDVDSSKLTLIRQSQSPIVEPGLGEMIRTGVATGNLRVTDDAGAAVSATDVSLVCVGTPSCPNGSPDLAYVHRVSEQIGTAIGSKDTFHVVLIRSTMLPGSVEREIIPILETCSGKRAGVEFGVAYNPEFLREGTSIHDYYHPSRTVIGQLDQRSGDVVEGLYAEVDGPIIRTSIREAEVVKYADNTFHAVKVTFANEIGQICKASGVDSHEVMDIFCLDTKLNLSSAYLHPGFAFGGSCLPKDVRALVHYGHGFDLQLPLLESIVPSNERQKCAAFELICQEGKQRVAVLGLSFKAGTDDLRESPAVDLVEVLVGSGYAVRIHDPNVSIPALLGTNRTYVERKIPNFASRMCESLGEILDWAEVIVVANRDPAYAELTRHLAEGQVVIDLVRIPNHVESKGRYVGIAW